MTVIISIIIINIAYTCTCISQYRYMCIALHLLIIVHYIHCTYSSCDGDPLISSSFGESIHYFTFFEMFFTLVNNSIGIHCHQISFTQEFLFDIYHLIHCTCTGIVQHQAEFVTQVYIIM